MRVTTRLISFKIGRYHVAGKVANLQQHVPIALTFHTVTDEF